MTRYSIALTAAVFVGLCVPAEAARNPKALEHYREGLAHYRNGAIDPALQSLSKALTEDPGLSLAYAARAQVRHVLGDREGMTADLKRGVKITLARQPEELVARGNALLLAGDVKGALKDFEAAIKKDGQFAPAYLGLGRIHRARGDFAGAASQWRLSLKHDPSLVIARYNYAWALHRTGKSSRAIKELTKALNKNRRFPLPYGLLGVILSERGDKARALSAYSKGIMLMPTYAFAHLGRAMVYLQMGKKDLAFKDFAQAAKYSPGDYAPYFNRGEVYHRLGSKKEAIEDFVRVLKLRVPDPSAAILMGTRFLDYDMPAEAVAMLSKALEAVGRHPDPSMAPKTEEGLILRARAYETLKDQRRALKDLDMAIMVSSGSARAWTSRGQLKTRMNRHSAAAKDLDKALEIDPKHAPALIARGDLLASRRAFDKAMEDYSAAIESNPGLAEAYANRGVLYSVYLRDFKNGLADLTKATTLEPRKPLYQLHLGAALLKNRDYWKAIAAFNRALELEAPKARVLVRRAEAHYGLGNRTKAFKDIDAALKEDPRSSDAYATMGGFRLGEKDYPLAVQDLNLAISYDKKNHTAYFNRGRAYGGLGEYGRSARDLGSAVRHGERPFEAYAKLCHAERLRGNYRRAIRACDRSINIDRTHYPAYAQRGLAHLARGSFERAVRDLDEAGRLGPQSAHLLLARSVAHAGMRQYRQSDEAYRESQAIDYTARSCDRTMGYEPAPKWDYQFQIGALARKLDRDSDDPFTYIVRGNGLHNAQRFDRAILEYTKALEMNDRIPAGFLARGSALAAQESLDAAEHDVRRAVELDPGDPFAQSSLVTLLTLRGKFGEGLKTTLRSLKAQAEHPRPETFVQAGNLRYFMKSVKKAHENFRLALKFDPNYADAYLGLGLCHFARRSYATALENFSRAISLKPGDDRYYRNRAHTYFSMKDYFNAAADYKLALLVNRDPGMIAKYEQMIQDCQRMAGKKKSASAKKK